MKTQKNNEANIRPSWSNKLVQYRIYYNYGQKKKFSLWNQSKKFRAGKMSLVAKQHTGFASSCSLNKAFMDLYRYSKLLRYMVAFKNIVSFFYL